MQMMKRKRLLGVAEIARATGMAASTVQYRLKRLNESGALLRRSLLVNYSALGFSMFEILVRCLGPAADVTKILRAFCKTSPGVKVLIRCFGDWDFKVSFCAKTLGEVLVFEESLQRALGAGLASSVIVPVRGAVKTGDFPAEDFKSDG
jgi:DNA-binding Lrp family transcriptional regulator